MNLSFGFINTFNPFKFLTSETASRTTEIQISGESIPSAPQFRRNDYRTLTKKLNKLQEGKPLAMMKQFFFILGTCIAKSLE